MPVSPFKQAYVPYALFMLGVALIFVWAIYGRRGAREGFENGGVGSAYITAVPYKFHMYYADWCPHCHTAKPEFEKLVADGSTLTIGGKKVLVEAIEGEKNPEKVRKILKDCFLFQMDDPLVINFLIHLFCFDDKKLLRWVALQLLQTFGSIPSALTLYSITTSQFVTLICFRYLHYYARQIVDLHPSAAERAEAKLMEEGSHVSPSRRLGTLIPADSPPFWTSISFCVSFCLQPRLRRSPCSSKPPKAALLSE